MEKPKWKIEAVYKQKTQVALAASGVHQTKKATVC